jgi:branched-chain amino acid transport system permease protein
LNGLQLASLLFLLAVGLSVVFGLMNFINLAHGTLYMLGAHFGLGRVRETGSFWLALALAPLAVAALGAVLHLVLLRRMQSASGGTAIGMARFADCAVGVVRKLSPRSGQSKTRG